MQIFDLVLPVAPIEDGKSVSVTRGKKEQGILLRKYEAEFWNLGLVKPVEESPQNFCVTPTPSFDVSTI